MSERDRVRESRGAANHLACVVVLALAAAAGCARGRGSGSSGTGPGNGGVGGTAGASGGHKCREAGSIDGPRCCAEPSGPGDLRGVAAASRPCSTATAPSTRTARRSRSASASSSRATASQTRPLGSDGDGRGVGAEPVVDAARDRGGVKDYVNVVSGTTITSGDERHHSGTVGILEEPLVSQPAGARRIVRRSACPASTRSPPRRSARTSQFEVGISGRVNGNEGTTLHYLAQRARQPQPARVRSSSSSPRLFASNVTPPATGATPMTDATLGYRRACSTPCSAT